MALKSAEQQQAQAEEKRPQRIAEAEIALANAEARLAQARSRVPDLTAAEVQLKRAREAEAYAQDEYNKSLDRDWERVEDRERYEDMVAQAIDDRRIAEADYAAAAREQGAGWQEIQILENEVAAAQLALEQARAPVDAQLAQEIERAHVQLARAEAQLEAATLIAPFDGVVTSLHLKTGDWAQAGAPAITLADLTQLQIETTDLDEWGAAHIHTGDPAEVTFTAFDDKTLNGADLHHRHPRPARRGAH